MLLTTDILYSLPQPSDPPTPLPGTTWAESALRLFAGFLKKDFGADGIRVRVLWTSQAPYQSGMCAGTLAINATGDEQDDDAIINIAVYDKHHIDEEGVITNHAIRMLTPVTF